MTGPSADPCSSHLTPERWLLLSLWVEEPREPGERLPPTAKALRVIPFILERG